MESLEVNKDTFDNIQGTNDLEMIDNVTKKAAKKQKRKARRKKILGGVLAVATGGVSKLATKKGRKQIGSVLKGAAGVSVLLPLVPLRGMMIKALNKEGIVATKRTSTVDLANRFYKNIVQKHDKSYDDMDINTIPPDHVAAAIGIVVTAIISFIKNIKKRKADGEKLSKAEELVAAGTEEAEAKINDSAKGEAATEVGTALLFDRKTQLIILAVVAVALYFMFRKRS
jgi:hypothetical protein